MIPDNSPFCIRLAESEQDCLAAQRLRYSVFVRELGGDGPLVDHVGRFERDEFDPVNDHLILVDNRRDAAALDHVVAVYRLFPGERASDFGRFYCDAEYDLTKLRNCGRRLLELGRSCVHPDYRTGSAMFLLWNGLSEYVLERGIDVMFGVASFHGTDIEPLKTPLSWLHHHHLAPEPLRVRAIEEHFQPMDLLPAEALDKRAALAAMPALMKAYLRLGGFVGEGAFVDHAFNTTDVMLLMDTAAMSAKHKGFYVRKFEAKV
ncbi:GNAT family N-acetyltransferase [Defluviimonas sp. WL0002]|uniref:L-ornithine N(alpha)-acyltransferase n=1 Tax=Albidovulum marisflavi TaxID=2984159 RepID=A0ABT2ZH23_9RHOB|nr:GNAT family N-acyltransferase [Defluviimonas sp. WL0002]MCV2870425.1 GNAT family N-acetyltransferase [Defluviimonas sp. WL0002]